MNMLKLKYKQHHMSKKRVRDMTLGGFELEAPHAYKFVGESSIPVRAGQLSTQFRLTIIPSGECSIPDTEYNREKLRNMFEIVDGLKNFIFEILSNIDLNEEAPHAGGGSISKEEERTLKQKIKDLEDKNKKLNADLEVKKVVKRTVKKTGGKAKKDVEKKVVTPLNLAPDLA